MSTNLRPDRRFTLMKEEPSCQVREQKAARVKKSGFLFTATFQDNQDGTVSVRYEASRPDASFIIPQAPGRLEFRRR